MKNNLPKLLIAIGLALLIFGVVALVAFGAIKYPNVFLSIIFALVFIGTVSWIYNGMDGKQKN